MQFHLRRKGSFWLPLILIATLLAAPISSFAQDRKPPTFDQIMGSGNAGTEFFVAIPPNEIPPYPVQALEIYIASEFDANVELYDYDAEISRKFKVSANTVKTLNDRRELNWSMEVREAEVPTPKALRLRSDQPITVCVLNHKYTSTDGYLAIPVSSWGSEYLAVSYYDFKQQKPWAGGFLIIATQPTQLSIRLRGTGADTATTSEGRSIGESLNVFLDEGEVYMVRGNAETMGVFDLTGSHIKADKPIGVIGFHMRTAMPNLFSIGIGRNHLCEMIPPLTAWGRSYSSIELTRDSSADRPGRGEMFRVVGRDAGTRWTMKSYNKVSGELLKDTSGVLANAGDFVDFMQRRDPEPLIQGFSVWESDKPILLMQYSCSSNWSGDSLLDPFMICVTPDEQYLNDALFQATTIKDFTKQYVNLVIKVDTADIKRMEADLQSLTLDGVPVWNHPKAQQPLLSSRMPNGMFWSSIEIGADSLAHRITGSGSVSFGGYVYGYTPVDCYGWPLPNQLGEIPTNPPADVQDDVSANPCFDVTPDKCQGVVHINLPDNESGINVDVYDLQGRKVKSLPNINGRTITIDLSDLHTGHFLISVSSRDWSCTRHYSYTR
ncbi:MAG: T9SS type A sorting domain-containing protein [Candidatus Kapabacteria bacterium]|nr:T9SS type A sorting domain-containing protein [Candidatus Kapabacteria bacterium]